MSVDTHITRCTRQRLAFPIGDVLLRLGISVLFGHAEVDDMDNIGDLGVRTADKEVVGFDVPIDHVLLVDRLYSRQLENIRTGFVVKGKHTYHLFRDHDNGLDRKPTITIIEQILETGTQQVNDQDVVQPFLAKVVDVRDAGCRKS